MRRIQPIVLLALAVACGDDGAGDDGAVTTGTGTGTDTGSGDGSSGTTATSASSTDATTMADGSTGDPDTTTGDTTAEDSTSESTGTPSACDFEAVDGMIVIEAEDLTITEDWEIQTTEAGYYGDGYIGWTRGSFNNDPTHGPIAVTIHVAEAGRYRLRWRNRIGMGSNTTEHNDTWVRFPDAADFYGLRSPGADESRRYPRPLCDDADAMAVIETLPQVASAGCVEGSSVDGWLKAYSSGASDWSWSTSTNDNDAHALMIEFDTPGDYAFEMAARGEWHLIDRIVIHEESLDDTVVQDPLAPQTACE